MTPLYDLIHRRVGSFRTCVLATVVMALLTMPPSEAEAADTWGDSAELDVMVGVLVGIELAALGLAIYDYNDFSSDSQPTAWNRGWDFALGSTQLVLALVLLGGDNPEVGLPFLGVSGVLLGHGLWETGRLRRQPESGAEPPPAEAAEPAASLSWTPVLLNREGDMGLGVVGRF